MPMLVPGGTDAMASVSVSPEDNGHVRIVKLDGLLIRDDFFFEVYSQDLL